MVGICYAKDKDIVDVKKEYTDKKSFACELPKQLGGGIFSVICEIVNVNDIDIVCDENRIS